MLSSFQELLDQERSTPTEFESLVGKSLEEAAYRPPTEPDLVILDFYALTAAAALYAREPGFAQGRPIPMRIQDDITTAAESAVIGAQELIDGATIYAICTEVVHVIDAVYESWEEREERLAWFDAYVDALADETGIPEDWMKAFDVNDKTFTNHPTERMTKVERDKASFEAMSKTFGGNYIRMANAAREAFDELQWYENYGKESWSEIASAYLDFKATGYNVQKLVLAIDRLLDLEHNTGAMFNKVPWLKIGKGGEGYNWVKSVLDFKFHAPGPCEFLRSENASPSAQRILQMVCARVSEPEMDPEQRMRAYTSTAAKEKRKQQAFTKAQKDLESDVRNELLALIVNWTADGVITPEQQDSLYPVVESEDFSIGPVTRALIDRTGAKWDYYDSDNTWDLDWDASELVVDVTPKELAQWAGIWKEYTGMQPQVRGQEILPGFESLVDESLQPRKRLVEMTDADQDKEAEDMLRRYSNEPTNLWLYSNLPIEDRIAWAYLAADAMKEVPEREDMLRAFVLALKEVVADPETFWEQIKKRDKTRHDYLKAAEWSIEKVPLTDIGVYPRFGGFPNEYSKGNVLDTAKAVHDDKQFPIKRKRILTTAERWATLNHFLPPILVPGGTLRARHKEYEQTKWDTDDGNHRLVAAAIAGAKEVVCFVGHPAGERGQEGDKQDTAESIIYSSPETWQGPQDIVQVKLPTWQAQDLFKHFEPLSFSYGAKEAFLADAPGGTSMVFLFPKEAEEKNKFAGLLDNFITMGFREQTVQVQESTKAAQESGQKRDKEDTDQTNAESEIGRSFESMVEAEMTYTPVEFSTRHRWVTEEMIRDVLTKYGIIVQEVDDIPREPSKDVPRELHRLVHKFRQAGDEEDDGLYWYVKALVPDEPEDLLWDIQDVIDESFGLTSWRVLAEPEAETFESMVEQKVEVPSEVMHRAREMFSRLSGPDALGDTDVVDGWAIETHTLGCQHAWGASEENLWDEYWRTYDEYTQQEPYALVVLGDPVDGMYATVVPPPSIPPGRSFESMVQEHLLEGRATANQIKALIKLAKLANIAMGKPGEPENYYQDILDPEDGPANLKAWIEEADPHPRKAFGSWVAKQWRRQLEKERKTGEAGSAFDGEIALEDASHRLVIHGELAKFMKAKDRKYLKGKQADINTYDWKSFSEAMGEIDPAALITKKEIEKSREEILGVEGVDLVHEDANWLIVSGNNPEALGEVTAGSGWCVKNEERAERYTRIGPVYIIYSRRRTNPYKSSPFLGYNYATAYTYDAPSDAVSYEGFEWRDALDERVKWAWIHENDPGHKLPIDYEDDEVANWLVGNTEQTEPEEPDPYEDEELAAEVQHDHFNSVEDDWGDALRDQAEKEDWFEDLDAKDAESLNKALFEIAGSNVVVADESFFLNLVEIEYTQEYDGTWYATSNYETAASGVRRNELWQAGDQAGYNRHLQKEREAEQARRQADIAQMRLWTQPAGQFNVGDLIRVAGPGGWRSGVIARDPETPTQVGMYTNPTAAEGPTFIWVQYDDGQFAWAPLKNVQSAYQPVAGAPSFESLVQEQRLELTERGAYMPGHGWVLPDGTWLLGGEHADLVADWYVENVATTLEQAGLIALTVSGQGTREEWVAAGLPPEDFDSLAAGDDESSALVGLGLDNGWVRAGGFYAVEALGMNQAQLEALQSGYAQALPVSRHGTDHKMYLYLAGNAYYPSYGDFLKAATVEDLKNLPSRDPFETFEAMIETIPEAEPEDPLVCSSCGVRRVWDEYKNMLVCPKCGSTYDEPEGPPETRRVPKHSVYLHGWILPDGTALIQPGTEHEGMALAWAEENEPKLAARITRLWGEEFESGWDVIEYLVHTKHWIRLMAHFKPLDIIDYSTINRKQWSTIRRLVQGLPPEELDNTVELELKQVPLRRVAAAPTPAEAVAESVIEARPPNLGFWILPDGGVVQNPPGGHHHEAVIMWLNQNSPEELARIEPANYEKLCHWAEKRGWAKVTVWGGEEMIGFYTENIPTNQQADVFKKYLDERIDVEVVELYCGADSSYVSVDKMLRATPEGFVRLARTRRTPAFPYESLPSFEKLLETEDWRELEVNPTDEQPALLENIEAMYELEYKHSQVSMHSWQGAEDRDAVLAEMEERIRELGEDICDKLAPIFEDWLEHHALTEPGKWAQNYMEQWYEHGSSPQDILTNIEYDFNERWGGGRKLDTGVRDRLSSLPCMESFIDNILEAERAWWEEEEDLKGVENPYEDIDVAEFYDEWIGRHGGLVQALETTAIDESVLFELVEKILFPAWLDYWKDRGIVETRKTVDAAYWQMREIASGSGEYSLKELTARINYFLNVSHQTGSMIDDFIGVVYEIGSKDLQRLSDRDTSDWDAELQQMGCMLGKTPEGPSPEYTHTMRMQFDPQYKADYEFRQDMRQRMIQNLMMQRYGRGPQEALEEATKGYGWLLPDDTWVQLPSGLSHEQAAMQWFIENRPDLGVGSEYGAMMTADDEDWIRFRGHDAFELPRASDRLFNQAQDHSLALRPNNRSRTIYIDVMGENEWFLAVPDGAFLSADGLSDLYHYDVRQNKPQEAIQEQFPNPEDQGWILPDGSWLSTSGDSPHDYVALEWIRQYEDPNFQKTNFLGSAMRHAEDWAFEHGWVRQAADDAFQVPRDVQVTPAQMEAIRDLAMYLDEDTTVYMDVVAGGWLRVPAGALASMKDPRSLLRYKVDSFDEAKAPAPQITSVYSGGGPGSTDVWFITYPGGAKWAYAVDPDLHHEVYKRRRNQGRMAAFLKQHGTPVDPDTMRPAEESATDPQPNPEETATKEQATEMAVQLSLMHGLPFDQAVEALVTAPTQAS